MWTPTFKGNAVARQIRTAEIYYLTVGALKSEGHSSINMNAGNVLNNAMLVIWSSRKTATLLLVIHRM